MTKKGFNLSERIYNAKECRMHFDFINVSDIKEFIDKRNELLYLYLDKKIDRGNFLVNWEKLVGDKLK